MLRLPKSIIWEFGGAMLLALVSVAGYAQDWDPTPKGDINAGGDKKRVPVVFVHGGNGAGEQFERQAMHFTSNGYPGTWVVAFDYSTAGAIGGARGPGGARGTRGAGAAPGATPNAERSGTSRRQGPRSTGGGPICNHGGPRQVHR